MKSFLDLIQEDLQVLELPTAARDNLINELFSLTRKNGIQGWRHLAGCLFLAIKRHHGDDAAERIFRNAGRMPRRLRTALRNATVLDRLAMMLPKPNVAKLARELAEENKTLPRAQQRGVGGIDVGNLEDHIRDLVTASKKHQARKKRLPSR